MVLSELMPDEIFIELQHAAPGWAYFVAQQPWGAWHAFEHSPQIMSYGTSGPIEMHTICWAVHHGRTARISAGVKNKGWAETLQKIKSEGVR